MNKLNLNCKVVFGENALDCINEIRNKSVLIVTDKSMIKLGVTDKVIDRLSGCDIKIFDEVVPDPPIEIVAAGVDTLRQYDADIIIAIGGGSVIDAAKSIKITAAKILGKDVMEWALIAIPTTSGTGSEVTSYSVITDSDKGMKYPMTSEELLPSLAILDPSFTLSVPPSITGDTGMDALSHALEAYVSTDANDFTDALCEKAIALIFEYLPLAIKDGSDIKAREKMHIASCMAGLAFNSAGLGVNHGLSHALGGKFHISHGRSNAIILPYTVRFNGDIDEKNVEPSLAALKYQKIAKAIGLQSGGVRQSVINLSNEITKLNKIIGIPATLEEMGIGTSEIERLQDEIIALTLADGTTQNNPRPVSAEQVESILTQLKGRKRRS